MPVVLLTKDASLNLNRVNVYFLPDALFGTEKFKLVGPGMGYPPFPPVS